MKILLIEDNPADAVLAKTYLEEVPDFVFTLEHIKSLPTIYSRDVDIILLDLHLAETSGLETLEKLIQGKPDCPIIVLTGKDDPKTGKGALQLGADDFLIKGRFESRDLHRSILFAQLRNEVKQLKEQQQLLEASKKIRAHFMTKISHDMRTPMNSIVGFKNLLQHTALDQEQQFFLDGIGDSSELLLGMINDILELSNIQNPAVRIKAEQFKLRTLVEKVIKVFEPKAKAKDLDLEYSIDPKVPETLIGDSLRLNQVLFNTIGNAIKFTEKGSIALSVALHTESKDFHELSFLVKDTGIGIPTDRLDDIFEPFTRLDSKDRIYEGIGLGLSICKTLIELMKGTLVVKSNPGEGTAFQFIIPFQKQISQVIDQASALMPVSGVDRDNLKILLVEDHMMNQIVAKKTLERKWGTAEIHLAKHGKEAVKMMKTEGDYDVILMDIQMPVMDGIEATDRIRNQLASQVPIIAMTAHAHMVDNKQYLEFGMNDIITKPFEPEQLYGTILRNIQQE